MAKRNARAKRAKREPKSAESSGENNGRDVKGRFTKGNAYKWPPGVSGNPKGRPTTHDELREFIQIVASESVEVGEHPEWPRLYVMLRSMLSSKNATDRANILEHGWGTVPKAIQLDMTEELRRLIQKFNLTPTDIAGDPVLALACDFYGVSGVKVDERDD